MLKKLLVKTLLLHIIKVSNKFSSDSQHKENKATLAFIKEWKTLNINPTTIGDMKRRGKGSKSQIDLNHAQIGSSYLKAMTASMNHLDLKEIKIQNIKENEAGIIEVIKTFKNTWEILQFEDSNVGQKSIDKICEWMSIQMKSGSLKLHTLILSNCQLLDRTGLTLTQGLNNSLPDLRELDLSRNKIGDRTCKLLGKFIINQYYLIKINLRWNQISSNGAKDIFDGMVKAKVCKNLNLSYNWLSRYECDDMLESMMKNIDESLIHLDLSQNNLSIYSCARLAELIKDNHSLFGLHMHGNNWYVDGFGFIHVGYYTRNFEYSKALIISPKIFSGYSKALNFTSKNPLKFMSITKWWVCEGWTENTFIVKPKKSISWIDEPLHIHFDYNNFQPELMEITPEGNYEYTTMWPPGKVNYFFTCDKMATFAKDHPWLTFKIPQRISDVEQYDEVKQYKITKMNYR
jgi:hypothetical protein